MTFPRPLPSSSTTANALALAALVLVAWLLRAFVVPAGPFHEDFHGYGGLGLDPLGVPGYPSVTSSYLAVMDGLGLRGERLIAANRVVSSLVVVPAALVAADLAGGALPGLLAGVLVAVHPLLARLGASEDPFAAYALLLLSAVVLARRSVRREGVVGFFLASSLAAAAAFVRDSTVVAGPVFAVLALGPLPLRRRPLFVVLALVPFVAGVVRVLTFERLTFGDGAVAGPDLLQRLLLIARWASVGGLQVLRTPTLFPALALGGLVLLAWRKPSSALRLVLALGLSQGPFAVALGTATSPFSPARHLSPAVVLWAVSAAVTLATLVDLAALGLGRRGGAFRLALGAALLAAVLPDTAWRLPRATVVEREYAVMRECLQKLPTEARVQPLVEPRTSHVAAQPAWLRAERPRWRVRSPGGDFDDRWEGRALPTVLLIDHGCTADVTMSVPPDASRAIHPTPWGPMTPACADAFRARPWQVVVRADLPLEVAPVAGPSAVPVGCLLSPPELAPRP